MLKDIIKNIIDDYKATLTRHQLLHLELNNFKCAICNDEIYSQYP